jgi:hypothetical protein
MRWLWLLENDRAISAALAFIAPWRTSVVFGSALLGDELAH